MPNTSKGGRLSFPKTVFRLFLFVCLFLFVLTTVVSFSGALSSNSLSFLRRIQALLRNASSVTDSFGNTGSSLALNPASAEENSASANLNARTLTKQKVSSGTLGQTHADRIVGKLSTEAKGKQTANGSDFQNRGTKEKKLKQDNSGSPKQTREKNHGKKGSHTMLGQPKPTEDEKRRLKFENALKWDGAPLTRGQPQWQRLDTDFRALVYSAHFDDVDEPPLVRVVGIVDETLPYQNVTCRFYDRDGRFSMHSVSGTIYRFRGRNGRK